MVVTLARILPLVLNAFESISGQITVTRGVEIDLIHEVNDTTQRVHNFRVKYLKYKCTYYLLLTQNVK